MQNATDRPYHHGALRRAVIETAMDMLREDRGWNFTLREIARRAGVSHAAPYKHFPDKAALLAELAMIGFDRLHETLMTAKPLTAVSPRDELLPMARAYVEFGTGNPALYRLMFSAEEGKSASTHLSERALAAFDVLLEMLKRGQAAGVFRKRPIQGQAAGCWALMHGITMLSIDGLLVTEKVGPAALEAALDTLMEGLETGDR